jgi:hypothetical protein
MPDKILFSVNECRRQVAAYKNDGPTLIRVCGHKAGVCTHKHIGANCFDIGVYQTIAGRNKFIDGVAGTCITAEAYEAELRSEAAERGRSIAEAGMSLATGALGKDLEATESEESDYRKALLGIKSKPRSVKVKVKAPSPSPLSKSPSSYAARFPTPPGKPKGENLGAGMAKTAQSGLKPAPVTVHGKAKKTVDVKPDPMVVALQQLTAAFGNLDHQFKGMNHSFQELQVRADEHEAKVEQELRTMKKGASTTKAGTTSQINPNTSGSFYVVAKGLNNQQGIYNSWSECASWVTGVPGNVFQKVSSLQDAQDFIDQYNASQLSRQNLPNARGNLLQEGPVSPGPIINQHGTAALVSPGPTPNKQGTAAFEQYLEQQGQGPNERPDFKFLGPDPSVKKEEEFYGQDTTAEVDLVDFMTPKGLDPGIKKGVCQAATDVVALQGGYLNSVPDSEDGLALFTQSITEMAHGGKADAEVFGRPDYNWRAGTRTGIKGLTSDEKLRRQIKLLIKMGPKIRHQTAKLLTTALKRGGWTNDTAIAAWAQGGPLYRMVSDTVDYYLSLHQHFMGLSTSSVDWNYVQTEINHHCEELTLIRSVADSRIQALVHLYCYLRDGHNSSWHSSSLQALRNEELFNRGGGESGSVSSGTQNGMMLCTKCGTTIHGGGLKACPWANLSQKKAKAAAAKYLRGAVVVPDDGEEI